MKTYRLFLLLITMVLLFTSCRREIMNVKSSIRRTQSDINVFTKTFRDVQGLVGVKEKNEEFAKDDPTIFAPLKQKTLINNYAYLYDVINGGNKTVTRSNVYYDTITNSYYLQDKIFTKIKDDKEVFGWHPYWMGNSWKNYPFELLSTVSFFSYKVDPNTGSYTNPDELKIWRNTSMIDSAKVKNTRVLLTVSCHGAKNNDLFLSDRNKWEVLSDSVSQLIKLRKAHGVDLNFENLPYFKRNEFNSFVKNLRQSLEKKLDSVYISVTLPALNSRQIYDVLEIQKHSDLLVIMGYDYNNSIEYQTQGAVAPLVSSEGNKISLKSTLDFYINKGIDRSKTVLALPYYGSMWEGNLNDNGIVESRIERKVTYSEVMNLMKNEQVFNENSMPIFDEISMTNYLNFIYEDGSTKEIWFDDAYTLGKKYDYAVSNDLKGIGIWALGYDSGYDELWNTIEDRFSTDRVNIVNPITEANGYPLKISQYILKNKRVFIVSALFFCFAAVIAIIILISDWKIRETFLRDRLIRLIFVSIVLIFIYPISFLITNYSYSFLNNIGLPPTNIDLFHLFLTFIIGIIFYMIFSKITFSKIKRP